MKRTASFSSISDNNHHNPRQARRTLGSVVMERTDVPHTILPPNDTTDVSLGINRTQYDTQPFASSIISQPQQTLKAKNILTFIENCVFGNSLSRKDIPSANKELPEELRFNGPSEQKNTKEIINDCRNIYDNESTGVTFVINLADYLSYKVHNKNRTLGLLRDPEDLRRTLNDWWEEQKTLSQNDDPSLSQSRKIVINHLKNI